MLPWIHTKYNHKSNKSIPNVKRSSTLYTQANILNSAPALFTARIALTSDIKLFFTNEMAVLFVLLAGDHHLVVVGVVSEQLPPLPGVAHRTETQDAVFRGTLKPSGNTAQCGTTTS